MQAFSQLKFRLLKALAFVTVGQPKQDPALLGCDKSLSQGALAVQSMFSLLKAFLTALRGAHSMGYCLCCHSHVAPLLGDCSSLFSVVLINTMTKSHRGKRGFDSLLRASPSLREPRQTVEELCLMACSLYSLT